MNRWPRPKGPFRALALLAVLLTAGTSPALGATQPEEVDANAVAAAAGADRACGDVAQSETFPEYFLWSGLPGECPTEVNYSVWKKLDSGVLEEVAQLAFGEARPDCAVVGIPDDVGSDFDEEPCRVDRGDPFLVIGYLNWLDSRPRSIPWGAATDIKVKSWRGYGAPRSTALATMVYSDARRGKYARVPVRVTVDRRATCGVSNGWYYLRVRVEIRRRVDRKTWQSEAGVASSSCSDVPTGY